MNRENAEKLLAALIFDDLDEASKTELMAYLETDDELRERLVDMRMAVKITSDALQHGPEPVLDDRRMKHLSGLAGHSSRSRNYTIRYLVAAAAVLAVIALPAIFMPSLQKAKVLSTYTMDISGGTSVEVPLEEPALFALTEESPEGKVFANDSESVKSMDGDSWGYIGGVGGAGYNGDVYGGGGRVANDGYYFGTIGKDTHAAQNFDFDGADTLSLPDQTYQSKNSYSYKYDSTIVTAQDNSKNSDQIVSFYANSQAANDQAVDEMISNLFRAPGTSILEGAELTDDYNSRGVTNMVSRAPDGRRAISPVPARPTSSAEMPAEKIAGKANEPGRELSAQTRIGFKVAPIDSKFGTEVAARESEDISKELSEFKPDSKEAIVKNETPKVLVMGDIPLVGVAFKSEDKKREAAGEQEYAEKTPADSDELTREINQSIHNLQVSLGQTQKQLDIARAKGTNDLKELNQISSDISKKIVQLEDIKAQEGVNREELALQVKSDAASVSEAGEINSPRNWKEISERRKMVINSDGDSELPAVEDEFDLPEASRFKSVPVNPWVMSERDPLSTFALDVDTASYTLCRRYIYGGFLPPAGAVRMEEFINYFNYQYPQQSDRTFTVHTEGAPSPFGGEGKNLTLLKIGVKARTIGRDQRKAAHLVFVIDTSASMGKSDRLPLIQQALNLLVDRLSDDDRVTLITCSNESRLHLEAASVHERDRIHQAINAIQASGSTNLLAGLQLGYATARRSFDPKQINHIVLCSDGVANVGQTDAGAVLREVAADRQQGITITCVGVGYGSYNDVFLESLANQGDGSYVYLDASRQAQEVFVEQLSATMHVVAKDARIQVRFNPDRVRRYRLIGYENRDIEDSRFRDDTVDAGEVGSGQCSTALYELELINQLSADQQQELGTVFVRYRQFDTGQMEEISHPLSSVVIKKRTIEESPRFFLAAAVSQFAEILRQSEHARDGNLTDVLAVSEKVSRILPLDRDVQELVELIRRSEHLPRAQ